MVPFFVFFPFFLPQNIRPDAVELIKCDVRLWSHKSAMKSFSVKVSSPPQRAGAGRGGGAQLRGGIPAV